MESGNHMGATILARTPGLVH